MTTKNERLHNSQRGASLSTAVVNLRCTPGEKNIWVRSCAAWAANVATGDRRKLADFARSLLPPELPTLGEIRNHIRARFGNARSVKIKYDADSNAVTIQATFSASEFMKYNRLDDSYEQYMIEHFSRLIEIQDDD